ncbi:protein of unknown function [Nitrosospira multiformis]|uniref:Uncharacterized protein n=1 Tax=Nitrosospira multiformis TaxID=1231 RepID=A0A1I7IAQ2_9PROT|nr:protein of unknown function [Nitrosospira multiformis]
MTLASNFRNSISFRFDRPLSDEQIAWAAPSIFAQGKHYSHSHRYAYIPTSQILRGLRHEGFEPFMVRQARVRDEGKWEYTKHMLRLRHASQINGKEQLLPDDGRNVPVRVRQWNSVRRYLA